MKSERQEISSCISSDSSSSSSSPQHTKQKQSHLFIQIPRTQTQFHHETLLSTPHKRPMMTNQTAFSSLSTRHNDIESSSSSSSSSSQSFWCSSFVIKSSAHRIVHSLCRVCLLRFHLRFLVLFSLPSLYFFFTNPHRFLVLNFLSILAFFITLLVLSLNLALPRFSSLRLLLSRSLPIKFTPLTTSPLKQPLKPVVWSIGSKPKLAKNPISGSSVKVYRNGDVYEGEFHKGKCSGSGVYYYYKKGRYEGDWIDGKYDGHGVETWARGSRYRGQYRQGLRHGIGVYRFYTGDVYAGEWSNGQCHGCGVYTCEDGSSYVGEFKWGVKHGLGHYHFRYI